MAGRVPAGTALSVRALADALRISKTPVRDALKRLEADGVIQARPRSAFYTAPLSAQEFDAILAVRLHLESFAAAEAARRASRSERLEIERAARRYFALKADASSDELSSGNYDFHFAIYRAAGNGILLDLISNLWVRMGPVLARVRPSGADRNVEQHEAACAAIAAGDPEAARAAVHEDIASAARSIRRVIAELERAAAEGGKTKQGVAS